MKQRILAFFIAVLLVIPALGLAGETARSIATLEEFALDYNKSIMFTKGGDPSSLFVPSAQTKQKAGANDAIVFKIEDGTAFLLLLLKPETDIIITIQFVTLLSNMKSDNFDAKDYITPVLYASYLQDDMLDLSFQALKEVGAFFTDYSTNKSGEYSHNGMTAKWGVEDHKDGPLYKLTITKGR